MIVRRRLILVTFVERLQLSLEVCRRGSISIALDADVSFLGANGLGEAYVRRLVKEGYDSSNRKGHDGNRTNGTCRAYVVFGDLDEKCGTELASELK